MFFLIDFAPTTHQKFPLYVCQKSHTSVSKNSRLLLPKFTAPCPTWRQSPNLSRLTRVSRNLFQSFVHTSLTLPSCRACLHARELLTFRKEARVQKRSYGRIHSRTCCSIQSMELRLQGNPISTKLTEPRWSGRMTKER